MIQLPDGFNLSLLVSEFSEIDYTSIIKMIRVINDLGGVIEAYIENNFNKIRIYRSEKSGEAGEVIFEEIIKQGEQKKIMS